MFFSFPFSLSFGAFLILCLGIFIASYARGFSGFGFSAIVVLTGVLLGIPLECIILAYILEVIASIGQFYTVRHDIDYSLAGTLLFGAFIGMPVGIIVLLQIFPIWALSFSVSLIVLIMSACLLKGLKIRSRSRFVQWCVGLLSGTINGAAVGGLPVGLLMITQDTSPARFRATMITYLFALDVFALFIFSSLSPFPSGILAGVFWMLPILAIGIFLGHKGFNRITVEMFRRFILFFLLFLCMIGIFHSVIQFTM